MGHRASESGRSRRGAQRAVLTGPAAEAVVMGSSVGRHLLLVLCGVEQAAETRDGPARERERR